ncbi:hypothetical protein AAHH79_36650, partial [Burkholderia pseudomallei]
VHDHEHEHDLVHEPDPAAKLAYLPVWEELQLEQTRAAPDAQGGGVLVVHRGGAWGLVDACERECVVGGDAGGSCVSLDLSGL